MPSLSPASATQTYTGLLGGRTSRDARRRKSLQRRQQAQPSQPPAAPAAAAAAEKAGDGGSAPFDATMVSWNAARAVESKTGAVSLLLKVARNPAFVGVQEIGDADFTEGSTLAATMRDHGYVAFQHHRRSKRDSAVASTHGGAALLVRAGIAAQPWTWPEADAWSAECESASVRVTTADGSFVVSSLYVHGGSEDTAGFERLMRSMRDDQVILGDLNAQMPGSRVGTIAPHFAERGKILERIIRDRGAMYPSPTGPTRYSATGGVLDPDSGTINDHIIVGCDVFSRVICADSEAVVLAPDVGLVSEDQTRHYWPSDHYPLVWSASLGLAGQNKLEWCKRIAWHRITDEHIAKYNQRFVEELTRARVDERRMEMLQVERALTNAAKVLPWSVPRGVKDGLFWTTEAQRRTEAAVAKHGEGARAEVTTSYAQSRKCRLAELLEVSRNQTSCWNFIRAVLAFKCDQSLRPPLLLPADGDTPARAVTDATERINVLAKAYATVHGNFADVDAQRDLARIVGGMTDARAEWRRISVTELRACISPFARGRCADFLGIRAEHLKLLDEASLVAMLPFVDRCLQQGTVPRHWRSATVTPVPKRGRDLSIIKSWRPVSVTALLCRLCETIVNNRIAFAFEKDEHRAGKSQFGFRRGVGTSLPLSGLAMFIRDGFRQSTTYADWDAMMRSESVGAKRGAEDAGEKFTRRHSTLLVSIDGSDAFCRALPARAVQKLLDMGLRPEARWVASLLTGRSLRVKDGDLRSDEFSLERGVPQGTILGPLLWSLVIDDLIERCEAACRTPIPGCVVVPIVFADDINFAIRGFNPSALVEQANRMLEVVHGWATENGVPMAKLQASWITGGTNTNWAKNWTEEHGVVLYDGDVWCVPSTKPIKLLGVTFDSLFKFTDHVTAVLTQCEKSLKLLTAVASVTKAEKLRILHEGLILSRMLYAVDVWYPYLYDKDKQRLQSMHYRACCVITGCYGQPDGPSVCYEAGFRVFNEVARDEIVKTADKLRRLPDGCASRDVAEVCFGPAWVARLFRDGAMPTAELRPVICLDGTKQKRAAAVWPPAGWVRTPEIDATADTKCEDTLRDVGLRLLVCAPSERRAGYDPRDDAASLRPLPAPRPYPPHELALFDSHVRFITDPPGGLIKPHLPIFEWSDEVKRQFEVANEARMKGLVDSCGADAIFIFTDGAREEARRGRNPERCAGVFVVCAGADPKKSRAVKHAQPVLVAPIACVYTAELLSIDSALAYVIENHKKLFRDRPRQLVLVTDSRSSLESMRTTWLSRIGRKEQEATRKLHDLAALDVKTTLAFVFSHVGGAPGNARADELAQEACRKHGTRWVDPVWNIDTTRRVLRNHRKAIDEALASADDAAFRFRNVPDDLEPSGNLPDDMPRWKERLVYRARVGMLPPAGGMRHGTFDECPFCCDAEALGRDGLTIEHLVDCVPACSCPPIRLCIDDLWNKPEEAAIALATISGLARALKAASR